MCVSVAEGGGEGGKGGKGGGGYSFRVTRSFRANLLQVLVQLSTDLKRTYPEVFQVINTKVIAEQVQQRILQHTPVSIPTRSMITQQPSLPP